MVLNGLRRKSRKIQQNFSNRQLHNFGRIRTGFVVLFGVICTILFLRETYNLTLQYLSDPVTSMVHTEILNISDYGTLYMCCKAATCFGNKDLSLGVEFARGYWLRHRFSLGDPDEIRGHQNRTAGYPSYAAMANEMKHLNINSIQEFLEFKSDIRYVMKDMNFTDYGMTIKEGTEPMLPRGMLSRFNSKTDTVCFPMPTMTNVNGVGRYFTRKITSDEKMKLTTGNSATFTVNTPPTYLYYLSFYTGRDWFFVEHAAYFKFVIPPDQNVTWGAYFVVHIRKSTELAKGVEIEPGVEQEDVACIETLEDTSRYPGSFARYKCEQECEDLVYQKMYGCSWIYILNATKYGSSNLSFCNQWLHGPSNEKEDIAKTHAWEECVERRQCSLRKYCVSWDISIQLTSTRGPGISPPDHNGNFVRFKFQMPVEKTHIIEVYMIQQSQWIGGLGGLLGMWIGLSVYCVAKFLLEALCWPLLQGTDSDDIV